MLQRYGVREHVQFAVVHAQSEAQLLKRKWLVLLFGACFQYVHSVATNVAYLLHTPRQPLNDMGFNILPALSKRGQLTSEIMFFILLFSTIFFAISPFLRMFHNPARPLYTVIMLSRFVSVLVLSQCLRIACFLVTSLPGPNYHCRPGSAEYDPPENAHDIFLRQDAFFGCGDLVFSSHTIFVCLCALTLCKYCPLFVNHPKRKWAVVFLVFCFCCLVIAARKHYSLDIVMATYVVPLVWLAFDRFYPDYLPPELRPDDKKIHSQRTFSLKENIV